MKDNAWEQTLSMEEKGRICPCCGNTYRVELLKESEDWNDFGYRYCPFCGVMAHELAFSNCKTKHHK